MPVVIALLVAAACLLLMLPARAPGEQLEDVTARLQPRLREHRIPLTAAQYLALAAAVPLGTLVTVRLVTGSWLTALLSLPAGPLLLTGLLDALSRRRTQMLRDQLQEALLSLAASLKAGHSLSGALERSVGDLRRLHPRGSPLLAELEAAVRDTQMGLPVDEALMALRERIPVEEVAALVDAVVIARRRGGNIAEVMANVAQTIADRLAIEREIQVMTAQKRAEAAILSLLPLGFYLLVRLLSPDYLTLFHGSAGGQIALGLIFLAIAAGYWLANRLAQIDV